MANKFEICAQACILIGEQPITSFGDGTSASIACANIYEDTVRDHLSRYRWRFAMGQRQLSRLEEAPSTRWDAAYQLPPDCLAVSTVLVNGNPVSFDRFEDMVFCNATSADEVYLEGSYRIDETFWPPYFVTTVIYQIASMLAQTLAADSAMSQMFDAKMVRQAAAARALDAQGRTAPAIDTTRLVTSRFRQNKHRSV